MKKNSSKTPKTQIPKAAKPVGKADRARAVELARHYRLILALHPEGGYVGRSVEMPLVFGQGKTEVDCIADTRDALAETIVSMYEDGEEPPAAADEGKRDVQFNLRFTADERLRIEERARVAGYTSVAEFIRRAALRYTG